PPSTPRKSVAQSYQLTQSWLRRQFESSDSSALGVSRPKPVATLRGLFAICITVFSVALVVRLLHWQDSHLEIVREGTLLTDLGRPYVNGAKEMAGQHGFLFPTEGVDPGDATLLAHPPGYSMVWRLLYGNNPSVHSAVLIRSVQVVLDAAACLIVILIAGELFLPGMALLAGLLAALSPHLAYHSLWLSPDSLVAVPALAALYLIIRANKRPRLVTTIAAGVLIGLSCWLRANAMLLAPFLAACLVLWFKQRRLRHAIALVGCMALAIAPITVRNMVVFHRFIPVAIDQGGSLVEGIGDYDKDGQFGLADSDAGLAAKDVEWWGRPDYDGSLWRPDGIERDRYRFARGIAVVRSNPVWFLGVMAQRMWFMLRYNDSSARDWLSASATVPVVAASSSFGHAVGPTGLRNPVWIGHAPALLASGVKVDPDAEGSCDDESQTLTITGSESQYEDQFVSAAIPVSSNTDYILRIPIMLVQGDAAAAIKTVDRRFALASTVIVVEQAAAEAKAARRARALGLPEPTDRGTTPTMIELPFTSADRTEVRLAFSNNRPGQARPIIRAKAAQLFELGPTPYEWTRYPRLVVHTLQKNLFVTWRMIPLILIGIVVLALSRRFQAVAFVLAVPIYYMVTQSTLHTEYRYIVPIHYFLFIFAGVSLYYGGKVLGLAVRSITVSCRPPCGRSLKV